MLHIFLRLYNTVLYAQAQALEYLREGADCGEADKIARDIIDANNAGVRSILEFLTQDKIATLQAENQGLRLAASQAAQNAYLVNELRPAPIPAYTVANPYCCNTTCAF